MILWVSNLGWFRVVLQILAAFPLVYTLVPTHTYVLLMPVGWGTLVLFSESSVLHQTSLFHGC